MLKTTIFHILGTFSLILALLVIRVGLGFHPKYMAILVGVYGLVSIGTTIYLFFHPKVPWAMTIILLFLIIQLVATIQMTYAVTKSINNKAVIQQDVNDRMNKK